MLRLSGPLFYHFRPLTQSDTIKAAKITAGATVVAALIGGGFFLASANSEDDSRQRSSAENQRQHDSSFNDLAVTATLNDYLSHLDQLGGRFSERDDFVERTKGISVRWRGSVSNVSKHSARIALTVESLDNQSARASVWFDPSMEARLYGLREGDLVEVRGSISDASVGHAFLDGDSFRLIP